MTNLYKTDPLVLGKYVSSFPIILLIVCDFKNFTLHYDLTDRGLRFRSKPWHLSGFLSHRSTIS